ncbi:nucleotide pyrophosphohydrolase [Enterococcus hirae]|jgi:NTP pyrophosphatase (non-canonical NTP hydrolase)|nr:nucleotide pyrophosphohydrolase [Enterococcaceae bacterium]MCI1919604.1 nucleotide pyrophosphohydrolase [Enterococcaceae bacterium]MDM8213475.1 nucleotide pyrophosphohydrolase [Enterococcus hirae]
MPDKLTEEINDFRQKRHWRGTEESKDLAISISLEAAELLELFQWRTSQTAEKQTERLKEELADVLIYSYALADELGFSVQEIIEEKLVKNAKKYPES